MIRKKKMFNRPKKAFQKTRMEEENVLLKSYGLKNKREVWKALAKLNYYRTRAKALTKSPAEEQEVFLGKLRGLGFKTDTLSDVLALQIEDLLKRRLPSVVAAKKLAFTVQQARQMVTHRKILVDGNVISIPGYIVSLAEEGKITSTQKLVAPKPAEKAKAEEAEVSEEVVEEAK